MISGKCIAAWRLKLSKRWKTFGMTFFVLYKQRALGSIKDRVLAKQAEVQNLENLNVI